jgi:hypothetical protein
MIDTVRKTIYYSLRTTKQPSIENEAGLRNQQQLIIFDIIEYLQLVGIQAIEIVRPEIYKHPISFRYLPDFQKGSIHLISKPIHDIRILKSAYNIAIVTANKGLPSTHRNVNKPQLQEFGILSSIDEIWVTSTSLKDKMQEYCSQPIIQITRDIKDSKHKKLRLFKRKKTKFRAGDTALDIGLIKDRLSEIQK